MSQSAVAASASHPIGALEQRVARQEAEMEALTSNVDRLTTAVETGFIAINRKLDAVSSTGRWTRQDIFAGGMFVIAVVSIASALMVSHVSGQNAVMEAKRDGDGKVSAVLASMTAETLGGNSRDIKVLRDRMTTAEGEFRTASSRSDFNQVLMAILWEKCMGTPLPAPILPNTAPFAGGVYP